MYAKLTECPANSPPVFLKLGNIHCVVRAEEYHLNRPSASPLTRLTLNARGAGMLCERESSAAQGPPGIFRLLLIQQFLPLLGRSTIFGIVGFEWPMD